ncbi:MAG: acyl carrier protein [Patescibacteria group bacterium]
MKEKLYDILSRVLEIDRRNIDDRMSPDNTPSWDSFNAIMLIVELEKAAGSRFKTSDLMAVKNVGDIKSLLNRHNIEYEC